MQSWSKSVRIAINDAIVIGHPWRESRKLANKSGKEDQKNVKRRNYESPRIEEYQYEAQSDDDLSLYDYMKAKNENKEKEEFEYDFIPEKGK